MAITIAELLVEIGVKVEDADKAQKQIEAVGDESKETAKKADNLTKSSKGLGDSFKKNLAKGAAAAAIAVAAAGAAIFKFVNDQTAAIDTTNKLATALGLPIEELQRLQFTAGQSGLSTDKLKAGIIKLNAATLDLQNGTGAAVEPMKKLGIGLKDLEGLSTTEKLGLIGERLQEVGDEATRSALTAKIFGAQSGPEMASLLAEGTEGLERMGAAAQNVMTPEQADRASDFQDRMGELANFVDGIANTIALKLLPPILEMIENIQAWVDNNDELINSGIDVFLTVLSEVWDAVTSEIKIFVAIVKTVIGFVSNLVGEVEGASAIFNLFLRAITAMFNPLNTLADLVELTLEGLEKLSIVSDGTAERFGASVDKMVNDAAGFDEIRVKADAAAGAVDSLAESQEDQERRKGIEDPENFGISHVNETPADTRRRKRAENQLAREQAAARRSAPRGGGGAGRGKPKKGTTNAPKKTKSSITFGQIQARLLSGDQTALAEDIEGLSARTPRAEDISPTVAITFNQVLVQPGGIVVTTSDPMKAATEVGKGIVEELASAGRVLGAKVVR